MEKDEDLGPIYKGKTNYPKIFLNFLFFVPFYTLGYPRNPYNDVLCNDVVAASGVFSAKEIRRLSKCKKELMPN